MEQHNSDTESAKDHHDIPPLFTKNYPVTVVIDCRQIRYMNKMLPGMFNVQKPSLNSFFLTSEDLLLGFCSQV